jgi:hypothetical protein
MTTTVDPAAARCIVFACALIGVPGASSTLAAQRQVEPAIDLRIDGE